MPPKRPSIAVRMFASLLTCTAVVFANGGGGSQANRPSRTPAVRDAVTISSPLAFPFLLENGGRIVDTDGACRSDVRATFRAGHATVFFRGEGPSYVFPVGRRDAPADVPGHSAPAAPTGPYGLYRLDAALRRTSRAMHVVLAEPTGDVVRAYGPRRRDDAPLGTYRSIEYRDAYPGIDAIFRVENGRLESSFRVHPGADPSAIRIAYVGASSVSIDCGGALVVRCPAGVVREAPPSAFHAGSAGQGAPGERPGGRGEIGARFRLEHGEIGFDVGPYDRSRTLVIDPAITWSTYFGGADEDWAYDIQADDADNAYACGETRSDPFPTNAGFQLAAGGGWDGFLVRFDAYGTRTWATLIGGDQDDFCHGLGVGGDRVTVSGWTRSDNFPVRNAAQAARAGDWDATVSQFLDNGALRWSTYFGGSDEDRFLDASMTPAGGVVAAGWTFSTNYPLVQPWQSTYQGNSEVAVTRFDSSGAVLWSTMYGGGANDEAWGVAFESSGGVVVGGRTGSTNFPTANAAQSTIGGGLDGFVIAFDPSGQLRWATYCGGDDQDAAYGIAVSGGTIALGGYTRSTNFPVVNASQRVKGRLTDGFVTAYTSGGMIAWSTFYGGSGSDDIIGIAAAPLGGFYIAGSTGSTNLPLLNALRSKPVGDDGFVARLTSIGAPAWATYFGGNANEGIAGVAASPDGSALICGTSNSGDIPTVFAFQPAYAGGAWDAFVAKIGTCPATADITVNGTPVLCPGASVLLSANAGAGFQYQWMKNGAPIDFAKSRTYVARDSGSYSVIVTNAGGCSTRSPEVTISVREPVADAGVDVQLCEGDSVALAGTATGGSPPYRFAWTPATGLSDSTVAAPTARPDTTTDYALEIEDALGCFAYDTVRVEVVHFEIDAGSSRTVCLGDHAALGVAIDGGIAPYAYEWLPSSGLNGNNAPDPLASPDTTTLYRVVVRDAIGCERSDTVRVFVRRLVVKPGANITLCAGSSGTIGMDVLEGAPPFSFQWNPSGGLSSAFAQYPVATPDSTTLYEGMIRDANGCSARTTVRVTILPRPVPAIAADGPLDACEGDSIVLRVTPLYPDVRWSTGSALPSIVVRTSGDYTVTVTDADGCTGRDSVSVRFLSYPQPAIVPLGPLAFCDGDSVTLDAGDDYARYGWSTGDSTRRVVVRRGGAYRVHVWNEAGCDGISPDVTVRVFAAPTVTVTGARNACVGSITSHAATAAGADSVVWTIDGGTVVAGQGTDSVRVRWTDAGLHLVRATAVADSTGCRTTAADTVSVGAALPVHVVPGPLVVLCPGDSIVLDAGPGYASYAWSTGKATRSIRIGSDGRYIVRVEDGSGCAGSDTVYVATEPYSKPSVIASPARPCIGDTVTLRTLSPYISFRWSTGDTTESIVLTADARIVLRVRTITGCTGISDTVVVAFSPAPAPVVAGENTACAGDTVRYVASPRPDAANVWTLSGPVRDSRSRGDTLLVIWDDATDTARVELAQTDTLTGCTGTTARTIVVTRARTPAVTVAGDTVLCAGETATLEGEDGFASYEWSTPAGAVGGRTLVVGASGRYTLRVRDSAGCTAVSREIAVAVRPLPPARIVGPSSVCIGSDVSYAADSSNAGDGIAWIAIGGTVLSGGGTPNPVIRWNAGPLGTLALRVVRDGCEARDTLLVAIGTSLTPTITPGGALTLCAGDSVVLDAGPGYASYAWSTGAATRAIPVAAAGRYVVTVRDASGCSGSDTAVVDVRPLPQPAVAGPDAVCAGDSIVLAAEPGYASYRWSSGETTDCIVVRDSGVYVVTATDIAGCAGASAPHRVRVLPPPPKPTIAAVGATLRSSSAFRYAWSRDGTAIPGATGQEYANAPPGVYTVTIEDSSGCAATSDPFDLSLATTAELALPDLTASPGDRLLVPVTLAASANLHAAGVAGFGARIRFDRRVLFADTAFVSVGDDGYVLVRDTLGGARTPLALVPFTVMLGPTDRSPLAFDSVWFEGAAVGVTAHDGSVRVRTCREGGDRLYDGGATVSLAGNRPNPFNAATDLVYTIVETGRTTLDVYDRLGRRVARLVDRILEPGTYTARFDAGALASGVYTALLSTPTVTKTRTMILEK